MKHLHLTRLLAFALALTLLLGCAACGKDDADDTGETVGKKDTQTAVELNGGLRVLLADGVAGVVRGLFAAGRAAEQQHERKREREHAGQVQMFHGVPPWVTG